MLNTRETAIALPAPSLVLSLFLLVATCQWTVTTLGQWTTPFMGLVLNELFIIVGIPLAGMTLAGFRPHITLRFGHHPPHAVAAGAALTIGSAVLLSYLAAISVKLFPITPIMWKIVETPLVIHGPFDLFLTLAFFCVLAPICEEILFRGLLQEAIMQRVGRQRAILFTAVFFALMHSTSWHPHLYLVLGFLLSWVYARTGTLRAPILCHMVNNTFMLVAQLNGLYFPLIPSFGWLDVFIFTAALTFVVIGASALRKQNNL